MKRWHPYQLLATVWTVGILAIAASLVASYLYEKDVRALWLPYTLPGYCSRSSPEGI